MSNFRKLLVWQKAMSLTTSIYQSTSTFPDSEIFGLTSQIRRASVSIPSNIAEGFGRETSKDFSRFLNVSICSLFELQTQLEIAKNILYINETDFQMLYENTRELERMLVAFTNKIKQRK